MAGLGAVMEIVQSKGAAAAGVLVIHSWWGLTPSFRAFGRDLAGHGLCVGLVDLFDGQTADTETGARKLRRMKRKQPMYRTLEQGIDALRAEPGGKDRAIGVVGFSMGGHWAIWLSQRPEYAIRATVVYYAARSGDFSRSASSYLAHFADDDPWVSDRARTGMERAIAKAGRPYQGFVYPETGHWFAERDRPVSYHPAAYRRALDRTAGFLRDHLCNNS